MNEINNLFDAAISSAMFWPALGAFGLVVPMVAGLAFARGDGAVITGFFGLLLGITLLSGLVYLVVMSVQEQDEWKAYGGPVEEPSKMTSKRSLIVAIPKMLFHVRFQHQ